MSRSFILKNRPNGATAGTTYYDYLSCGTVQNASTTEAQSQVPYRIAGRASNLKIYIDANDRTAMTIRFRKNTANGNMVVTIPASTTGTFEDTTNFDDIAAGDLICLSRTIGTGGTVQSVQSEGIVFEPTDTSLCYMVYGADSANAQSTNNAFALFCANIGSFNNTNESQRQQKFKHACTLSNFFLYVTANTRTDTATYRIRKNSSNGNAVINVLTTQTGKFEDNTNTDSVVANDLLCYGVTFGAGVNTITVALIGVHATSQSGEWMWTAGEGNTVTASTNRFLRLVSQANLLTVETQGHSVSAIPYTIRNLIINVLTNTITAASIMKTRVNASNGRMFISIPASTTGYFEDATNMESVRPDDKVNIQWIPGTSGTNLQFIGVSYTTLPAPLPAIINNPMVM